MKTLLWLSLVFLCFSGLPLEARMLGVRGLALGGGGDMPERYVRAKDGYELLSFSADQPGELINGFAGETLPLFEKVENEEGKPEFQITDNIPFPQAAKGVLILGWIIPEGARYLAINDDFSAAKYDNWLMINTGLKSIAFQIGEDEKPFIIKPNSTKSCKIASPGGVGAAVLGRAQWGERVRTFYSTYWPIREGERSIVIFVERGNRISVSKITDILLKKESDGKAD